MAMSFARRYLSSRMIRTVVFVFVTSLCVFKLNITTLKQDFGPTTQQQSITTTTTTAHRRRSDQEEEEENVTKQINITHHHHHHNNQHQHHQQHYQQQQQYKDHSYDVDVLDLLEWEQKSLNGLLHPNPTDSILRDTCQPPSGMSRVCCLGTFSMGGMVTDRFRGRCAKSMDGGNALKDLRDRTRRFFDENPLPNANTDNTNTNNNSSSSRESVECDVCRIMDLAFHHNLSITFIGDSMHSQIVEGFICELQRRNYNVSVQSLHEEKETTWLYRQHFNSKIYHIHSHHWQSSSSSSTANNNTSNGGVVTIQFHLMYLLPLIDDPIQKFTSNSDIVILGFGLHWWYTNVTSFIYKREENYVLAMKNLFLNITQQGNVKLLIHRETSAQHFNANGGEYSAWNETQDLCQPIKYTDSSVYWREKSIKKAAYFSGHDLIMAGPEMPPPKHPSQPQRRPEIIVLPYFYFTSHYYIMHPFIVDNSKSDCTHYCSSPYIYYPLWRSFRFAMDRQFG